MKEAAEEDRKNQRLGWVISFSVQIALLILCYFLVAWKAPFPPIPIYGIELGVEESASAISSASTDQPNAENQAEDRLQDPDQQTNALIEGFSETLEASISEVENEAASESNSPSASVTEVAEATVQESVEATFSGGEETEQVKQEEERRPSSSTSEVTEVIKEEKSEKPVQEEQVVDQRALMPSSKSRKEESLEVVDADASEIANTSTVDTGVNVENGISDGASLSLSGWKWDSQPRPDDQSTEVGKITYQITVNENGSLTDVKLITSTVSPAVERKYRAAVKQLTFSKVTSDQSSSVSTGLISFILRAK
ncbi:MAG: hypothetical protein AAF616_10540 [Bacteroidota bacterium]